MRQFCIGTGTFALLLAAGCSVAPSNLERASTRVAATRYEVSVKSVLGLLSSPQSIQEAWDAEAAKACRGRPWDAISREFVDSLKTGMKGLVECR